MLNKILFLVPYPPEESPSQRFRFEQYLPLLEKEGFEYKIQSFLSLENWQLFYRPGKNFAKALALIYGFLKRLSILLKAPMYDFVFIHREATPVGPPFIEWVLAKILRRKIIYDFDDAIWLTDRAHESFLLRALKWRGKVKQVCKWSYKISCGNVFLSNYARLYNSRVVHIPTTIDTENWHNPALYSQPTHTGINIGWTGSHSTLKYLTKIEHALNRICTEYSHVHVVIIADKRPSLSLPRLKFIPWNKSTEVKDLMNIDIGIMPLPDDEWAKGKCGFKALQYLALNIPSVVSPVGVNTVIIDHGKNGYFAETEEDWYIHLKKLISNDNLRKDLGAKGRKKVIEHYSVISNASSFLSLFE